MFKNIPFIKSSAKNDETSKNYAPMFRRKFVVEREFSKATLYICGLGYIYSYINGRSVSDDLFTAPVSNYNKTLWYNEYDVTEHLKSGNNIFAAICGNGWYNETIKSAWDFDKAEWRDTPKLIMCLEIDGKRVLSSDRDFVVSLDSPITYNQLRSGEHFDSRLYDYAWNRLEFDDALWDNAVIDKNAPKGVFRKCECEPIRECAVLPTKKIIKTGEKKYIFDLEQTISGYIRLDVCQKSGTTLRIRYAEMLNSDNTLNIDGMDNYYLESEIQTDYFICNGEEFVWSPKFVYHGFRYIEIDGIEDIEKISVSGVFVHQDIKRRSGFKCSYDILNKLFECGVVSSYSNMFYNLTDCPTREKLGWTNDARASCDQMLTNFEIEKLFEKWIIDIQDSMKDDGCMPCIIPTAGWGYEWGNGPVSDGVLFEMPYQVYLHTGKPEMLKDCLPYFEKYLKYMEQKADANGDMRFGLNDWAYPGQDTQLPLDKVYEKAKVPVEFINDIFKIKFLEITELAARLCGKNASKFTDEKKQLTDKIKSKYIDGTGRCIINEQTAVAMLIYYDIYIEFNTLKKQLCELISQTESHHNCGMVGIRHLFTALNKCGMQNEALDIITADDYPSHGQWLANGATSLWEMWGTELMSRNHHMYSDFMSWTIKTVLGIAPDVENPGYKHIDINPCFIKKLTYAEGYRDTVYGRIAVEWHREKQLVLLEITIPDGIKAVYGENTLKTGKNSFTIPIN